jgi:hypothetical protein
MSEVNPELQRVASHALEKAEDAHLSIIDLKRDLHLISEELSFLKTFSRRLLDILKQQYQLDDPGLNELIRQTEGAELKLEEKPGSGLAPLCPACQRPLQQDSAACIYCGDRSAR